MLADMIHPDRFFCDTGIIASGLNTGNKYKYVLCSLLHHYKYTTAFFFSNKFVMQSEDQQNKQESLFLHSHLTFCGLLYSLLIGSSPLVWSDDCQQS